MPNDGLEIKILRGKDGTLKERPTANDRFTSNHEFSQKYNKMSFEWLSQQFKNHNLERNGLWQPTWQQIRNGIM